jgi:hypothetical protein
MLTDMTVRQAKATGKPYTIADFDGLYLHISAVGGKAWHFRYTWVVQRARISLGSYPELSLREARELRDEARSLVARGINPRTERKQKRQAIKLAGEIGDGVRLAGGFGLPDRHVGKHMSNS